MEFEKTLDIYAYKFIVSNIWKNEKGNEKCISIFFDKI